MIDKDYKGYYSLYTKIPLITSILTGIAFFISLFVIPVSYIFYTLISGIITTTLTYIISKIMITPTILQIEALESLAINMQQISVTLSKMQSFRSKDTIQATDKKNETPHRNQKIMSEVAITRAQNYKDLLDKGIISQETYEKRIAELKDE